MKDFLAFKIAKQSLNCSFSLPSIKKFLALMQNQQKQYSDFSYLGNGSAALVLKAKKDAKNDVALKIIEINNQTQLKIAATQGRQAIVDSLKFSEYFVAVNNQFILSEISQNNEESSFFQRASLEESSFFVQEVDLCQGSLREVIEQFKLQNTLLTETFKVALAIQMLDAVNLLHSKQIPHGAIRKENFLATMESSILLKLHKVGTALEEDSIKQDLVSLGLIFLELDNIQTFDSSKYSNSELSQQKEGKIFEAQQLNRNSQLYNIASLLVNDTKNKRDVARLMLLQLLQSSKEYEKIKIFSVVLKSSVSRSSCLGSVHNKMDRNQQYQHCVLGKQNKKMYNKIISQFKGFQEQDNPNQLTADLLKSALTTMLDWEEFEGTFEVLGVGPNAAVFGVENLIAKRQSILKLSLCPNQADAIREIGIMRICQSPYIVKFYGHKFFEDTNGKQFVVYELERCKYSLFDYLELQRIKMQSHQHSEKQKYHLMFQILDSVGFLHKNNLIHRNITLDNFMITENLKGEMIIKLSNFKHADSLMAGFMRKQHQEEDNEEGKEEEILDHFEFLKYLNNPDNNNKKLFLKFLQRVIPKRSLERQFNFWYLHNSVTRRCNRESVLYFAPERWQNPNSTTYQTDIYAVGLCLILLDNYLIFSEYQLAQRLFSSLHEPYDDVCKNKCFLVNADTEIYSIAKEFLWYLPKQRKSIENVIDEYSILSKVSVSQNEDFDAEITQKQQKIYMNVPSHYGDESIQLLSSRAYPSESLLNLSRLSLTCATNSFRTDKPASLKCPISSLVNLSSISIDLLSLSLGPAKSQGILLSLGNLSNLSSLSLDLSDYSIGDSLAQNLLHPLANLVNLSSISLNLRGNQFGPTGASYLLCPFSNLINLSVLQLNLGDNNIGNRGASNLLIPITNIQNLSFVSLILTSNSIIEEGASHLLSPLANLINLQSLALDLKNNQIQSSGAIDILKPLANLINLSTIFLTLDSNSILSAGAESLLLPLANLINLQCLKINLDNCEIEDIGAYALLIPLKNLFNLLSISLNLNCNSITAFSAKDLLSPLANLTKISTFNLNLCSNTIEDTGAQQLLCPLSNLINLSTLALNLTDNSIQNIGAQYLLQPLTQLKHISSFSLKLSCNKIGDKGASSLLQHLSSLINLKNLTLEIVQGEIEQSGAKNLLVPLKDLLNLTSFQLDLSSNFICNNGAICILQPISRLINLQHFSVSLSNNQIDEDGGYSVLLHLSNLLKLSNIRINIDHNKIGNTGGAGILRPLENLINLRSFSIDLFNNQISSDGANGILLPLKNLINLKYIFLNLNYNKISEQGAESLLVPLRNLKQLSTISVQVRSNQISSRIESMLLPLAGLFDLKNLSVNLGYNRIGDSGASSLLCPLRSLNKLSTININLEYNGIEKMGAQWLLIPLSNLLNISRISLVLSNNRIGDIGSLALLVPLVDLQNLTHLQFYLQNNQISQIEAQSFLSPLSNISELCSLTLNLNDNQINDFGAYNLLLPLQYLTNLLKLSLSLQRNTITDIGIKFLLTSLKRLFFITDLSIDINCNSISDTGMQFLFSDIIDLTESLDLSKISFAIIENLLCSKKRLKHLFFKYLPKNIKFEIWTTGMILN